MNPDVEKVLPLWGARVVTSPHKLNGSVALAITDAKITWLFGAEEDPFARHVTENDDDADCVIRCTGRVILDIEDRQITPQEAFQGGSLQIKGETELALDLFGIVGEAFRL